MDADIDVATTSPFYGVNGGCGVVLALYSHEGFIVKGLCAEFKGDEALFGKFLGKIPIVKSVWNNKKEKMEKDEEESE